MIKDYYEDLTLTTTTTTTNSFGAEVTSEVNSTIQGVINQANAKEIEYAKAREIEVDYHCYLEVTIETKAIKKNDKINGYRVTMTPKNTMNKDHHLKILLAEAT